MTQPEHNVPISEAEVRVAYVEDVLRPTGVLHDIAQTGLVEPLEITPQEAGDIVFPPKQPGATSAPRWESVEKAPAVIKAATESKAADVIALADQLDMRRAESLDEETLARIDPANAIFCIEGGANRTSVVRRALAIDAMTKIYGDDVENQTVYQFGADVVVSPTMRDGSANPAYGVAQEIAGGFLPEQLTEFSLNVASAQQAGFEVAEEDSVLVGRKANAPKVVFIQQATKGGLKAGFTALKESGVETAGKQLVIATNGQYRPKDELQAVQWAAENEVYMLPPVAIGDEAGYTVEHNGATLTTAQRAPVAYVNEMVVLHRIGTK